MRLKLLLFLLMIAGALYAQEPYRNLIFSEIRLDEHHWSYAEITNMGDKTIDLAEFEFGTLGPWNNPNGTNGMWYTDDAHKIRLPHKMLAPGESFLLATIWDLAEKMAPIDPEKWNGARHFTYDMNQTVDLGLYPAETGMGIYPQDSISPHGALALETWSGRNAFYIRHFYNGTDSVVTDAVNAIFDDLTASSGSYKRAAPSDVAGVTGGTGNRILVRKFTIKQGVGDALDSWTKAAGVDIADSEWLPIPVVRGSWNYPTRKQYWTLKNHGNFILDANTLTSATTVVNFAAGTLTVPYGTRRWDGIINQFVKKPGVAWSYKQSVAPADSAFFSCRTGDTLTIYVVGNTLMTKKFAVIAAAPTNDAKVVIPKHTRELRTEGPRWYSGEDVLFNVTENKPGMDSILTVPFATRVDSLLKYLEKPDNATWQIVWVDGKVRVDLKRGDKLKVTAQNGTSKEYYIKVENYLPSHEARLTAITWPDIPADLRGTFGWAGDTIPNFVSAKFDYVVEIPAEISAIPAFIATPMDLNCKIDLKRATSFSGSFNERTMVFTTTAEDDTTILHYNVTLNRLKSADETQPYNAEPFISQFVWQDQWANGYIEVVNPGNQPLDMSRYMFAWGYVNTPAGAITRLSAATDWANRYGKYIPGYKWVDQATWETKPSMVIQDLAVNPIVQPGDVFVVGDTRGTGQSNGRPTWGGNRVDVDLATGRNPWGETVPNWNALQQWNGANWYLFRIDNDSIVNGLKPANNPADFTLIDVFGSGDGSAPVVGGKQIQQTTEYTRKPAIYKGNPDYKGSFGTSAATSEWLMTDRDYWGAHKYGWPWDILMICDGLGSHFMDEVTIYKSTVTSIQYKVSEGYSNKETIRGVKTNTTVADFLSRLIKANANQTLTVKSSAGKVLAAAEKVNLNDTLIVVSADNVNTTKYLLNVTVKGFSNNAILTSSKYYISVDFIEGAILLIPYGTTVKAALQNVVVPEGAVLTVINQENKYVPYQMLNFDSVYVDVMVTDDIVFNVVAEDGVTQIRYTLTPSALPSDAFVTSILYNVNQTANLISLVPRGTSVSTFLNNVYPVVGASMKLIDKAGYQRTIGNIAIDDKLVVTSKDGKVVKIYYISALDEEFFTTRYLAYVLSDTYKVDQASMVISGPTSETLVATFKSKLTAAFGANVAIVNAQGNPTTTTDLNRGDRVKVTAADGTITYYDLALDYTNVSDLGNGSPKIWPNPTSGKVFINGLTAGSNIEVINMLGASVIRNVAGNSLEVISLDNQPSGLYFIKISDGNKLIGKYKLIKQ